MLTVNFNPFPTLETERLLLRQYTLNDVDDLFQIRKNEDVMKYIGKPTAKTTDDVVELINLINKRIEANEGINWAIINKTDNKLVGMVSLHRVNKEHHRAELGYMLHPDHWNKRIATEAVKTVIEFGFKTLNLHSIEALIDPRNEGSKKLLINFNFVKEAHFKENYFYENKFIDTEIYSLLNN